MPNISVKMYNGICTKMSHFTSVGRGTPLPTLHPLGAYGTSIEPPGLSGYWPDLIVSLA